MSSLEIAIVTMDRPEILRDTLERLEELGLSDHILVVDGSSNDHTKKVCDSFDIVYFRQKSSGMTSARNEALNYCSSENIVFIDDDSMVSRSWFNTIKEELNSKEVVGATGKLEDEDTDLSGLSGKIRSFLFGGRRKFGEISDSGIINGDFFYDERKEVDHMPGCNMAYDVDVLKSTGGFSEEYDVGNSYREDTVASYKIGNEGKIIYNPEASVNHLAVDEEGDTEKWLAYKPYLTRYFLLDNQIISGLKGILKHLMVQIARHAYFLTRSVFNKNLDYIYYLKGEFYGILDFQIYNRKPRGIL